MDRANAELLIDELGRHPGVIPPDVQMFVDLLTKTNVPETSRFYETIPYKKQLLEESKRYHYLSLRRILRNKNSKYNHLSAWKRAYEAGVTAFKRYSSDVLTRRLRLDNDLINMMAECEHPFSLLAKFQTYDYDNPDETLYVITRPVLVIPGVKDERIEAWENANTDYRKEIGTHMFRWERRINPSEYLAQ